MHREAKHTEVRVVRGEMQMRFYARRPAPCQHSTVHRGAEPGRGHVRQHSALSTHAMSSSWSCATPAAACPAAASP